MGAIAFEAFGVALEVTVEGPEDGADLAMLLPPGSRPAGAHMRAARFLLTARGEVVRNGEIVAEAGVSGRDALAAALRAHVALHAPGRVFVHAGAVALEGRAILLPGRSFSGKTTLVAELIRNGASYLSDEFAVLDATGRVHPYPKPLSMRLDGGFAQTDVPAERLSGVTATGPAPVGTVAILTYRSGAAWGPSILPPSVGALALLANTVSARTRPAEALGAVTQAVRGALVLHGERGHASDAVRALIAAHCSRLPGHARAPA